MELCDLVDDTGTRTGNVAPRGSVLAPGEFYLVVNVWIRDDRGRYLVQQRAAHLARWPGVWATTTGYVQSGEESRTAAIREVQEELSITLHPEQLKLWKQVIFEDLFEDVWLAEVSSNTCPAPVLSADVAACLWATKTELAERIRQGTFYRYNYFHELPE